MSLTYGLEQAELGEENKTKTKNENKKQKQKTYLQKNIITKNKA